jgi:hypothetical protein
VCSQTIEVGVPVGPAFGLAADVTRWPLWLTFVVSAQQPELREIQLGEDVHLCMREGHRRWQEEFEVTRYVRNAFFWLEGEMSASRRIELRFEQRTNCTRITVGIGYPVFGGWFGKATDALFRRPRVASELNSSLMHLKSVIEEIVSLEEKEPLIA